MRPQAENILKGKTARLLASELLSQAGNAVYPLAPTLFDRLLDIPENSEVKTKLSSIPDFLVLTRRRKPCFLEVKFRTDPESLEEELLLDKDLLEKFWKARILLVTTKKPHFRLLIPPYFEKSKKEGWPVPICTWIPLHKDALFGVTEELEAQMGKLVRQYYGGK